MEGGDPSTRKILEGETTFRLASLFEPNTTDLIRRHALDKVPTEQKNCTL